MYKDYAIGLPSKSEYAPISQSGRTRLVIQKHIADKAGKHYDMRLRGPGGVAHSWVIKALPGERDKMLAIQQPTHTAKYMSFQGKIESGYGAGTVSKAYDQKIRVLSATNDRIKMVLPEGTFTMIKPKNFGKSDKNWLMIKSANNKGYNMNYEQIKQAAFVDELEKIALKVSTIKSAVTITGRKYIGEQDPIKAEKIKNKFINILKGARKRKITEHIDPY